MRNWMALMAASAAVTAVAVACGSSSSSSTPPGPVPDGGGGDDSAVTATGDDDGSASMTCIPLGTVGCAAGQDLECCLDLSAGLAPGTCVKQGTCTSSVAIACENGNDCSGGQVCCADFGGGTSLAAIEDSGLGALGIDASSLSLDAGAAGLGGLGGLNFKVSCAASCTSSQIQACSKTSECAGGGQCLPITALLGDGGGMIGDAGVPAMFAMYAGALGMIMACVPPTPEGGTTMSVPDSGGATDAEAPTDAPSDAVTE
jgi:hypothetical protein